jgi:hypothetical protein
MKDKNSFVLYADLIHTVKKLPDDKAGLLLKLILAYVNDENPETDDIILQISFEPIKQQLKRDLVKWGRFVEKQSENGKLGGRPEKPKNPSLISETKKKPTKPKKAVSVSVNVNDSVIDNEIVSKIKPSLLPTFFSWLEFRKGKNKPLTNPKTIEALVDRFVKEPETKVIWVVNASIENDWQGLFWDKYTESPAARTEIDYKAPFKGSPG